MATHTDGGSNGYTFRWKIENRSNRWCLKTGDRIESPDFVADALESLKWSLSFYPMGNTDENYVGLYLDRKIGAGPSPVEVSYKLAFLSKDESVLTEKIITKYSFRKGESWGFHKFEKRKKVFVDQRTKFCPEDTLTLQCTMWKEGKPVEPKIISVRTIFKEYRRSYEWRIDKISYSLKHGVRKQFKDQLIIFDLVLNEDKDLQQKMCINISEFDESITYFSFKTTIIDSKGGKENCHNVEYHASDLRKGEFSFPIFAKNLMENKSLYLQNDVLSLDCECIIWARSDSYKNFESEISTAMTNEVAGNQVELNDGEEKTISTSSLATDLKSMYDDAVLCDLEVRTSTKTFKVHKTILSARSPVFRSMLRNDMKEKNSECVNITDFEDDIVHSMLLYLYTDSLEGLQFNCVFGLYAIADKYEILPLKMRSSSFLKVNLCPTNFCEVLDIADLHHDDDLKSAALNYILEQPKEFFRAQKWKEFLETHSDLAKDIMLKKICQE